MILQIYTRFKMGDTVHRIHYPSERGVIEGMQVRYDRHLYSPPRIYVDYYVKWTRKGESVGQWYGDDDLVEVKP